MSAALHLHGWSNHSASTEPASIVWHTQQEAAAGVDLLWWTDHSDIYLRRVVDFKVTPTTPVQVTPGLWALGTWGPASGGTAFLHSTAAPSVDSSAGRVDVPISSGNSAQVDTIELFFGRLSESAPVRAAFGVLARPLVGRPRFAMTVRPLMRAGSFPDLAVLVPLAWHPDGERGSRDVLRYVFEERSDTATLAVGDTIDVHYGWPSGDSAIVALQPAVDAVAFPDGLDNTTDEYRVRFVVHRQPAPDVLSFTLPTIVNTDSTAAVQMPPAIQLAHSAAQSYGVRTMWGLEVGPQAGVIATTRWYATSGAGTHLALYLPEDLSPTLESSLAGQARAYAALVASLGGVTSIPHPFGTSTGGPVGTEAEQLDEARQLGAFLVQNGAWNASLIEVGYLQRGGVGLRAHLLLLDYLHASGLRICGVGVSDSHGGPVLRDPLPGSEAQYNFVTWIGGVTRAATGADLIAAMRACNLSFGAPFYTRGGLWISVESDSSGRQTLSLDANGVSPSADFFLYEAAIDSTGIGHDPAYRQYRQPVARSARPAVGGCTTGFARLEAWAGTRALAFSNVVRVEPDPSMCRASSSAHRLRTR